MFQKKFKCVMKCPSSLKIYIIQHCIYFFERLLCFGVLERLIFGKKRQVLPLHMTVMALTQEDLHLFEPLDRHDIPILCNQWLHRLDNITKLFVFDPQHMIDLVV